MDCIEKKLANFPEVQGQMYSKVISTLKTSNKPLWFKTELSLCKLDLREKRYDDLTEKLSELKTACLKEEALAGGVSPL